MCYVEDDITYITFKSSLYQEISQYEILCINVYFCNDKIEVYRYDRL